MRPREKTNEDMAAILAVYQVNGDVQNEELYREVSRALGGDPEQFERKLPVGKAGKRHCLAQRKVRWYQQSLKRLGLLERVPGKRAVWRLRPQEELTPVPPNATLVGFSTDLGLALWSSCDVFSKISERCALILTSPPYCLAKPRRYGGPTEQEMVDFVCSSLEPIVKNMLPGASLALNVSNDIFVSGSPARSMYVEKLTIALDDRLSLRLMDRLVWVNPTKAPGPMQWASKTRQQLNVAYEHVLWMTNDPLRCFSDNRRVLEPHTERHQRLMASGGERRSVVNSDGAYRINAGKSYSATTPGRIPRNVITVPHQASEISSTRALARAHGLPVHGALMPLQIALFLVRFLTRPNDLVVDPFGGWATSALAAEQTGRRWLITERIGEYVAAQALRMSGCAGFRSSLQLLD